MATEQNLDQLSFDTDAALANLANGGSEVDDADVSDVPADEAPEQEAAFDADASDFFGSDGSDKGEDAESKTEQDGTLEPIRFKEDGVEQTLDPVKDRDEIAKRLAMYNPGKRAFTEVARLRKEMTSMRAELKEQPLLKERNELLAKMEEADDDIRSLYQIWTNGGDFDELVKKEAQWMMDYADADESGRKAMLAERKALESERKMSRLERAQAKREARASAESERETESRLHSSAVPIWREAITQLNITDPAQRKSVANLIWKNAWIELHDAVEDPKQITTEMIRREMVSTAKLLGATVTQSADKRVEESVTKIKTEAKDKAGAAATRHYQRPDTKKYAGKGALGVFEQMRAEGAFKRKKK